MPEQWPRDDIVIPDWLDDVVLRDDVVHGHPHIREDVTEHVGPEKPEDQLAGPAEWSFFALYERWRWYCFGRSRPCPPSTKERAHLFPFCVCTMQRGKSSSRSFARPALVAKLAWPAAFSTQVLSACCCSGGAMQVRIFCRPSFVSRLPSGMHLATFSCAALSATCCCALVVIVGAERSAF